MSSATLVPDEDIERARMDAVRRYDILDTPPDGAFDRVTALAARFCRVPIATVTIVDEDRIWFKSAHGIDVDQIDREPGLCASAILADEAYVVTDAALDPRTLDNSLVRGELGLRFYVGIPLRTHEGHRLGTLNVIDAEAREVSADELQTLEDLAAIVVDELELRLAARRQVDEERVREAERVRDTLLAGISHDMKTPLAALRGLAALAADGGEWPRDAMHRQVGHLEWLVNQFIHFATLERGVQPIVNRSVVDLRDVLADAADIVSHRVTTRLRVPSEPVAAICDADRTRQIVVELLNNAARFSDESDVVELVLQPAGDHVNLMVTDHGPGVPPTERDRVFERFQRGTRSTGTGIGLYVSRALAEAQDGSLTLTETPGGGATFTLTLPA